MANKRVKRGKQELRKGRKNISNILFVEKREELNFWEEGYNCVCVISPSFLAEKQLYSIISI